jgi:hypothetical protein
MTRRKPNHVRHCSCAHVVPDWVERWRANPLLASHPDLLAEVNRILTGSPWGGKLDTQRARILAKVTIPDAQGHQYWTGARPQYGLVRAMHQGVILPVVKWLYLWSGPDKSIHPREPLLRLCRQPDCISPLHHEYREPASPPTSAFTAVALWELDHPRPWPARPTKWDTSNPTGERCLAGHGYPTFKVYDPRKRKTYCAACAEVERAWLADRARVEHSAEYAATGIPHRAPNQPTLKRTEDYADPDPEPTLSDLLEAGELGA